jgi:hypothetical protein
MTHALTAHLGLNDFNAALLASDAAMLHALVLTAQALIILYRTKDLSAEEAIFFGLKRPIVDGLRLFDLSVRPIPDLFWRSQADSDGRVVYGVLWLFVEVVNVLHDRLQL